MEFAKAVHIAGGEQPRNRPALDGVPQEPVNGPAARQQRGERIDDKRQDGDADIKARIDADAQPRLVDRGILADAFRSHQPIGLSHQDAGPSQFSHAREERGGLEMVTGGERVEVAGDEVGGVARFRQVAEQRVELAAAPFLALLALAEAGGEVSAPLLRHQPLGHERERRHLLVRLRRMHEVAAERLECRLVGRVEQVGHARRERVADDRNRAIGVVGSIISTYTVKAAADSTAPSTPPGRGAANAARRRRNERHQGNGNRQPPAAANDVPVFPQLHVLPSRSG